MIHTEVEVVFDVVDILLSAAHTVAVLAFGFAFAVGSLVDHEDDTSFHIAVA